MGGSEILAFGVSPVKEHAISAGYATRETLNEVVCIAQTNPVLSTVYLN